MPRILRKRRYGSSKGYAAFTHQGHVSTIRGTMNAIWNNWLPASEYEAADAPGFERYDEAKLWLMFGRAAEKRYGSDHNLELVRLHISGVVAGKSGDTAAAIAAHEQAFAASQRYYSADSPLMFSRRR